MVDPLPIRIPSAGRLRGISTDTAAAMTASRLHAIATALGLLSAAMPGHAALVSGVMSTVRSQSVDISAWDPNLGYVDLGTQNAATNGVLQVGNAPQTVPPLAPPSYYQGLSSLGATSSITSSPDPAVYARAYADSNSQQSATAQAHIAYYYSVLGPNGSVALPANGVPIVIRGSGYVAHQGDAWASATLGFSVTQPQGGSTFPVLLGCNLTPQEIAQGYDCSFKLSGLGYDERTQTNTAEGTVGTWGGDTSFQFSIHSILQSTTAAWVQNVPGYPQIPLTGLAQTAYGVVYMDVSATAGWDSLVYNDASAYMDPVISIDPDWAALNPGYSVVVTEDITNGAGSTQPGGGSQNVPEPGSLPLLGAAGLAWLVRHRRPRTHTPADAACGA